MVSDITGPAIQDAEIRRLRILLEQAWRLLAIEVKTARQEGQAAGAKAWVVKPFRPEQLLVAVSKLILP